MKPGRGRHRKKRRSAARGRGGALAAAAVSSALVAGTVNAAPAANATCVSFFGFGTGTGCTSNPSSFAIAIGEGAVADSTTGILSGAIAIGKNARSTVSLSGLTLATAFGEGASASALTSVLSTLGQFGRGEASTIGGPNLVLAFSDGAGPQTASVIGGFNVVTQFGPGSSAALGGLNLVLGLANGSGPYATGATGASGFGNLVVQLGPGIASSVGGLNLALGISPTGSGTQATTAGLFGTLALNVITNGSVMTQAFLSTAAAVLGTSDVQVVGILGFAGDAFGTGNQVSANASIPFATAFSLFGRNNAVTSGPGPLSIAGSILQTRVTVQQNGPGIALQAILPPRADDPLGGGGEVVPPDGDGGDAVPEIDPVAAQAADIPADQRRVIAETQTTASATAIADRTGTPSSPGWGTAATESVPSEGAGSGESLRPFVSANRRGLAEDGDDRRSPGVDIPPGTDSTSGGGLSAAGRSTSGADRRGNEGGTGQRAEGAPSASSSGTPSGGRDESGGPAASANRDGLGTQSGGRHRAGPKHAAE